MDELYPTPIPLLSSSMSHFPFALSGLADEAADDIDGQILAQKTLGWPAIELRLLKGKQVCGPATSDADFSRAMDKIEAAGLTVSSFGSAIGNWARPITGDFDIDLADLRVLIPRMQRARTKFVRTMSWVRGDVSDDQWREEGLRRYRIMAQMAADGGITLLHENCEGWGGHSAANAKAFMESLNHPHVRYLFDIGNTVSYGQDTLEFYRTIRPWIAYVHVKDCRYHPKGEKSNDFTYPGQGEAKLREVLTDLIRTGYTAGITIEPHVANIVHLGADAAQASPQVRFDSYVRYGRELETLLTSIR